MWHPTLVTDSLVGRSVDVLPSDPWETVTLIGAEPMPGRVHETFDDAESGRCGAIISLDRPICYRGARYAAVAASPRHAGVELAEIASRAIVPANFVALVSAIEVGVEPPADALQFIDAIRSR
jgi:hypothetical protein